MPQNEGTGILLAPQCNDTEQRLFCGHRVMPQNEGTGILLAPQCNDTEQRLFCGHRVMPQNEGTVIRLAPQCNDTERRLLSPQSNTLWFGVHRHCDGLLHEMEDWSSPIATG